MNKADTYDEAESVLKKMDDAKPKIPPNVITFSTLMNKADTYDEAESVLKKMDDAKIPPNVITFNTLMDKAADFKEAKPVFEEMKSAGILPNRETFSTLFSKDPGDYETEDIYKYYLGLKNCPSTALEPLIKRYYTLGKYQDAYYLILNHPHLPASRKIVGENFSQAVSMYEHFKTKDFYEKNIDYALGIAYLDVCKLNQAIRHLKKALMLASTEQRKEHIRKILEQIESL
jgi:tetratricopeptide (TPR) repeat protein